MNLGFYSYLGATIAYGLFTALLFFSWRESLQGKLIFIVMLVSTCWALSAAQIALHNKSYLLIYQVCEILRYIAWYVFLFKLFEMGLSGIKPSNRSQKHSFQKFVRWALPLSVGLALLLLLNEILVNFFTLPGQYVFGITGNVVLALIALAIIEQLFRNTSARHRWATKYLFLGVGGIFIFDFYLYADALLFRHIDKDLWAARGVVHVAAVPLLAISAARNKNWSLNIFVSRDIILNTTVVLSGGFYLLAMSAAGYYLREFGGDWGEIGQMMFLTLAVVFLFVVMTSSQLRAKTKVFITKHFYKNKYDYRIEWLRLTDDLNNNEHGKKHYQTAIKAMANIVEARSGLLWLRDEYGNFNNVDVWQSAYVNVVERDSSSLLKFLDERGFVINVKEIESCANEYDGLVLPDWLDEIDQPWLIIPLHRIESLQGFVILANPLVVRSINWEDRDLLKTAAKQITSYLTVLMTSSQLAEAKQFEVFSRLSAYMVHDLKNISAELELIAINAKKHRSTPEFIDDAFDTVENASADINRLLAQLRNRQVNVEKKVRVDLVELISEVVIAKQHQLPAPKFKMPSEVFQVTLNKDRLANVLAHLIENAQQATKNEGEITIALHAEQGMCSIEIKDNGLGMDEDFIRDRLFKPFDTTKGNAGMGIGVYESREFIRQLGGDVYVQSKSGEGTIICLRIPLNSSASDDENNVHC